MIRFLLLLAAASAFTVKAQEGLEFSLSEGPGTSYLIMNEDSSKTASNLQFSAQVGILLSDKVEVFSGL